MGSLCATPFSRKGAIPLLLQRFYLMTMYSLLFPSLVTMVWNRFVVDMATFLFGVLAGSMSQASPV